MAKKYSSSRWNSAGNVGWRILVDYSGTSAKVYVDVVTTSSSASIWLRFNSGTNTCSKAAATYYSSNNGKSANLLGTISISETSTTKVTQTCSGSSWGGDINGTSSVTIPAQKASFNLNVLLPDGSEPYDTGAAGSVERSINGGSYARKYNEEASTYAIGTTFAYRNFTPGTGLHLASVSGVSPTNTTGPWSLTLNSGTTVTFQTAWNTYNIIVRKGTGIADITSPAWGWTGNYKQGTATHGDSLTINASCSTGYHWGSWSGTYSTSTQSYTFTVNKAVDVTANAVANTYTVAYNGNGATGGSTASSSHTYGSAKALTANGFTRTGYTFAGWNTKADGTGTNYSNQQSVTNLTSTNGGTVTLYAKWTINSYSVTIKPGSGTYAGSASNQTFSGNYNTTKSISYPTPPTGHVFAGYYTQGPLSGISTKEAIFQGGTGSFSVYNNSSNGTVTHTRESNTSVPNLSMGDSGVGHQIKIVKSAGTASPGCGGFVIHTSSAANKVYRHIIWAKIPKGYTINDHRNAIGAGGYSTWLTERKGTGDWYRYVYEVHTGASGNFSTFGHVALSADNGDNNAAVTWYVCASQITDVTSSLTYTYTSTSSIECFYAPLKSTITYNANGGSGAPASHDYTYASSGTTTLSSTEPTRTGYTFLGWSLSSTATSASYTAGQAWNLNNTGNYTLYAVWQINKYTIAYNANGGSSTPASGSYNYNSTQTLASAISKANTDSNITITITYNANGGSSAPSASTGTAVNTTPYTFNKWALNSTSGTQYAAGASYTVPAANSTFYALWNTGTTTRKSNPSITLSSTKPTKSGYNFKGWSTSSTATTATYSAGTAYTFSANTTLYAVWELAQANLYTKKSGAWEKGPAYVKVGGAWKTAKQVYTKVNGTWVLNK